MQCYITRYVYPALVSIGICSKKRDLIGTIQTQLNEKDLTNEEKRKYMEGRTPLGRVGVPSDIAGPAVFLASDFSRYMSGSQMLVGKSFSSLRCGNI